jgi:hypothetical protein
VYEISAALDSGLTGRWEDGGIAVGLVRRGGLTTFERARGYFCAFRVARE